MTPRSSIAQYSKPYLDVVGAGFRPMQKSMTSSGETLEALAVRPSLPRNSANGSTPPKLGDRHKSGTADLNAFSNAKTDGWRDFGLRVEKKTPTGMSVFRWMGAGNTIHPAASNILLIWLAKLILSGEAINHINWIFWPRNGLNALTIAVADSGLILRGSRLFSKASRLILSASRLYDSSKLRWRSSSVVSSNWTARSLALAALPVASAIRASASSFIASLYRLVTRHNHTVRNAVSNPPTTRTRTYSANTRFCVLAATSIGDKLDWIVVIAFTIFIIGIMAVGVIAIVLSFRRQST